MFKYKSWHTLWYGLQKFLLALLLQPLTMMWVCYALDNLSQQTAATLKEAIDIQLLCEADLTTNDYRYMSEWDNLTERRRKYESAIDICQQYLGDKIHN